MFAKRFRNLLNVNVAGAIGFIAGTLLSALLSVIIGLGFQWSYALIEFFTLALILLVVFFLGATSTHIQHMAETLTMHVDYVEEPYRAHQNVPYRGDVYTALERQIRQAKHRILVVAAPTFDAPGIADHPARRRFLQAIDEIIRSNAGQGFSYTRVLQVKRELKDASPTQWVQNKGEGGISQATYDHCRNVLLIEHERATKGGSTLLKVEILARGSDHSVSPFIMIDNRWLVIETDGVAEGKEKDSEDHAYIANFFFLDDQMQSIIPAYDAHAGRVMRNARSLSIEDFPALIVTQAAG